MASRSRESIMKRVRENKRREKAARKRERRLERKQSKNNPDGLEYDEYGELIPGQEFVGEDGAPTEDGDGEDEPAAAPEPVPAATDDR
jgi:hypothetical protein